jgi:hypothetical protein
MEQDCDLTPTACELRRIADQLSEPGWLDIASGLVLPVVIALATLWVALYASGIAKRTNEQQVELEENRVKREARAARLAIMPDLDEWATWTVLFEGDKQAKLKGEASQKMRAHEQQLGDPSLASLRGWIGLRALKRNEMPEDAPDRETWADVYSDVLEVMTAWADDPESLRRRQRTEAMQEAFAHVLANMEAQAAEVREAAAETVASVNDSMSKLFPKQPERNDTP